MQLWDEEIKSLRLVIGYSSKSLLGRELWGLGKKGIPGSVSSVLTDSKKSWKCFLLIEHISELASVHPLIHVSILKKCGGDPFFIFLLENISLKDSLSYEKNPIKILNKKVQKLRTKDIAIVKELWRTIGWRKLLRN